MRASVLLKSSAGLAAVSLGAFMMFSGQGIAADGLHVPGIDIRLDPTKAQPEEVATSLKVVAVLTVLSLVPAILVMMTSFTRIIVVLAMLRHALGTQDTPPNTVLTSLALFLTLFTMQPTLSMMEESAFKPYMDGRMGFEEASTKAIGAMREFMVRQTREQDLMLMIEVAHAKEPAGMEDIKTVHLIPAFMLSELKTAFQIGFVVFLPFLLLDLVVSSILMSMGMLMVPPMMISLPLKLLMFVLIDGWNLVVRALLGSFH